jgi:pimeloyl-ACP methyl ester carboxylesterase
MSASQMNIEGVHVCIEGEGPETVVMIHGWPDTHRLWDDQVVAFKAHYRCVRFTLPGFDLTQPRRAHSLAELVAVFKKIVEQTSPGQPVTLLLHDWGCYFGYQFALQHPTLVRRIVGVDVGDVNSGAYVRSLPLKAKLGVAAYQLWLALAWGLGGRLGDKMTRFMARAVRCPTDPQAMGAQMNYPYVIQWTGKYGSYRHTLPVKPECPMLFVYGSKKLFLFHTRAWAQALAARPGSAVKSLPTRHWVMRDQPEQFNELVLGWLGAKDA